MCLILKYKAHETGLVYFAVLDLPRGLLEVGHSEYISLSTCSESDCGTLTRRINMQYHIL